MANATEPPSQEVLQKICNSKWGEGKFAKVTLWRDHSGKVKLYQLEPDITLVLHAPHIYYDESGVEKLTVADKPFDPNSAWGKKLQKDLKEIHKDYRAQETLYCSQFRSPSR